MRNSLPSIPLSQRNSISEELLSKLKMESQEASRKIRVIKAKTAKLRQTLSERDVAINKAMLLPKSQQKLSTASKSKIKNLKAALEKIKNTRNDRQRELTRLLTSDAYWKAEELKSEIITLYNEQMRLIDEVRNSQEEAEQLKQRNNVIEAEISSSKYVQEDILQIQKDIVNQKDIFKTYSINKSKQSANDILLRASKSDSIARDEKTNHKEIIEKIQAGLAEYQNGANEYKGETEDMCEELDELILETIQKINDALAQK